MKKGLIIFTFLLLIFPIVSAVDFQLREQFDQGETLLARISGNFLESIVTEDVFFFRGHVRIPMVYDVTEFDDDFYIYALLTGKEPANYSVVVKNTKYMKGIEISEEDLVKNFTITENLAAFSVNPGFVKTSDDFFIEVQNLQETGITLGIAANLETTSGNSVNLKSGEIKKINFELGIVSQNLEIIELITGNFSYLLPVFITTDETIPEKKESKLRFEPSVFDVSMATNSDAKRIIHLRNTGETDLEDIFLFVSPLLEPYVSLSIDKIDNLEKNSSKKIELFLLSDEEELIIEGKLIAQAENTSTSSTIIMNFIRDFIPLEEFETEIEVRTTLTCSEEGGTVCAENEECSEDVIYSGDGVVCCIGICEKIEKKGFAGKIIGWSILILVILILYWFYKKRYKGVRRKVDLVKRGIGKK